MPFPPNALTDYLTTFAKRIGTIPHLKTRGASSKSYFRQWIDGQLHEVTSFRHPRRSSSNNILGPEFGSRLEKEGARLDAGANSPRWH